MPSKRKTKTNAHNFTNLFTEIITKLLYITLTIGFIFALCHFILPDKPTQNNSLIVTPTLKLENTPTIPPISPTKKLEQTATPIVTQPTITNTTTPTVKPTIHIATPTIKVPTITIVPTTHPIISITPSVYCSFLVEQLPPTFTGTSYIIADLDTKEILLSYQPELPLYPASTIKLLTAMVGLDLCDIQNQLTLSETVFQSISSGVAKFGVPAGTTYSLEVWLNLLLVRSFGDAANTIAEGTAGSIESFIIQMNNKIKQLRLNNTIVDNAIGLDIGDGFSNIQSTATDMLTIAMESLKYPLIREMIAKPTYIVPATNTMPETIIQNSHPFLSKSDMYHSPLFKTIGGKTGTTNAAGNCLITIVKGADTHNYICVYFGGKTKDTMSKEIIELLEYIIQFRTAIQAK